MVPNLGKYGASCVPGTLVLRECASLMSGQGMVWKGQRRAVEAKGGEGGVLTCLKAQRGEVNT